jgi:hypothetical protein
VDPRAIVRLEGIDKLENAMTSSRIKPATFRLVAQCLKTQAYQKVLEILKRLTLQDARILSFI